MHIMHLFPSTSQLYMSQCVGVSHRISSIYIEIITTTYSKQKTKQRNNVGTLFCTLCTKCTFSNILSRFLNSMQSPTVSVWLVEF